ncbi:MAG TPA: cysteine--1-D-myo-inosityl 2-amino-2-deoxy-alpha-D-glucopyranoside ligase, partial [Microlunatus sp.]|nr:cysteine--1-D-myo-inosityl 2-amino-2-deoxy-alpha-D-glucopyranoside ligase [Microlunatus sp.]
MQAWRVPEVPHLPGSGGEISVYDTARGAVVPVGPPSGTARMYVCGITPYDATHLGHANTYLAFDLLNRAWRDRGLEVDYVQNVTDVDDPLLERAEQTGADWTELARDQIELFRTDMIELNVLPPDHYVGAVESIGLVTELIERLREVDGAIYPVSDPDHPDLYFARAADGRFGSLSGLDDAEAEEVFAERGGDPERAGKKDPLDCLLWQAENPALRPGDPAWDSALGRGRPGWHI